MTVTTAMFITFLYVCYCVITLTNKKGEVVLQATNPPIPLIGRPALIWGSLLKLPLNYEYDINNKILNECCKKKC